MKLLGLFGLLLLPLLVMVDRPHSNQVKLHLYNLGDERGNQVAWFGIFSWLSGRGARALDDSCMGEGPHRLPAEGGRLLGEQHPTFIPPPHAGHVGQTRTLRPTVLPRPGRRRRSAVGG